MQLAFPTETTNAYPSIIRHEDSFLRISFNLTLYCPHLVWHIRCKITFQFVYNQTLQKYLHHLDFQSDRCEIWEYPMLTFMYARLWMTYSILLMCEKVLEILGNRACYLMYRFILILFLCSSLHLKLCTIYYIKVWCYEDPSIRISRWNTNTFLVTAYDWAELAGINIISEWLYLIHYQKLQGIQFLSQIIILTSSV